MQIKEGGYYRTRDGRKAGPAKLISAQWGHWDMGDEFPVAHEASGEYFQGETHPEDLVAEWSETDRSAGQIISEIEERLIELRSLLS